MEGHGPANWVQNFPIPFSAFVDHPGKYEHVNSGLLVTIIIAVFSVLASLRLRGKEEEHIVPPRRATLAGIADYLMETVFEMVRGTLGDQTKKYFPFLGALFLFILVSNLFGLIPYAGAPTSSMSTSIALGISSFVFYNVMGIKEVGIVKYLDHLRMGVGGNFFMFCISLGIAAVEILSHIIRPITLSGRLGLNMFMDHFIVHTFKGLVPLFVPVPLMIFGVVVSLIQAFVFATLTAVYLQLAVAHDDEHHEGAHH